MILFSLNLLLLGSLVQLPPAFAKLFNNPSEFTPKPSGYDYIIVGGGTAGNVVAARLTEDSDVNVLVIEAGVSNEGVTDSIIPLLLSKLVPNTLFDWNYTTTAQPGYNSRSIAYPRGRMLGGSSSVNFMIYSHGSSDDWDRYAAVTGDHGWNWTNIRQYVDKNEKFVPPVDHHNTTGEFNPALHGFSGAVHVTLPNFPSPFDPRVIATTQELSEEFPFNEDTSGGDGTVLGIGWILSATGGGSRSSSATAYLDPALNRKNLDVIINAQVTKLLTTGDVKGVPSFRSVQFTEKEDSPLHIATAKKEVILSAGTVGTPIILQLSGIGNKTELASLGIKSIVDNPSVGSNLSDHTHQSNPYSVVADNTFDDLFRNPALLNAAVAQWNQSKTGPLTDITGNQLGFLRLPQNSSIFQAVTDPSAGPHAAHFELVFANLWSNPGTPAPPTGHFLTISNCLISPTSRGSIKLASSNPFDKPLIDPNFLSTQFDIFTMIEGVKATQRFVQASAWKDFIVGPAAGLANVTTDAEIEDLVRNTAGTLFHPVGTASMSPAHADWGVVGADLKVKGVEGLRIIDGSVLPFLPSAHIHGPIYLVAERGADLIKRGL